MISTNHFRISTYDHFFFNYKSTFYTQITLVVQNKTKTIKYINTIHKSHTFYLNENTHRKIYIKIISMIKKNKFKKFKFNLINQSIYKRTIRKSSNFPNAANRTNTNNRYETNRNAPNTTWTNFERNLNEPQQPYRTKAHTRLIAWPTPSPLVAPLAPPLCNPK